MSSKNISTNRGNRRGIALVTAMIFLILFSSIAVGFMTFSTQNASIADNYRDGNRAFACAQSGAEVMRHWLDKVAMDGTIDDNLRYDTLVSSLDTIFSNNGITSFNTTYDGSCYSVADVSLGEGESFSAEILPVDNDTVQMNITGMANGLERTIACNYTFGVRETSVFDFGVATRGTLELSGNIDLDGTNISVEASVYIESPESIALSIIGNSRIAGDVNITNEDGDVNLQGGQAEIGGDVFTGVPPTEFPAPNPGSFEKYLSGQIIDSTTDLSADATFTNARVLAGTNPHFSGDVTIEGVLYIETPNQVTFGGNVDIIGVIVGDGDVTDDSQTNTIDFTGNVSSTSVASLPLESQFDGLRDETGTFLMTPGFSISMGGNFGTLNGCIAANGVDFYGNAGGTIEGSIVNYSQNQMTFSGNSDLYFNRSGVTEVPAGFEPEIIMHYDPTSYSEITGT
ncbi:Tfp pilus assembly protein PilX [Anaerohalosphaera lusitana]|uniref:Tfp pilus assembly protein PilX n=1 Tax=Anaerohalosphaera lusitana TaxID=1936003 RepID=A0A1U9NKD5_9BACT|nr:pilus assembly PilX N-terminal domain-containing protein [Anaerohalosphaera lusitana]AQT68393.1 Tfp pilus assembly protein PilX [Anaerohalosphaera lusitana]